LRRSFRLRWYKRATMSLRLRVLSAIACVLLIGASAGVMFGLWDAQRSLRAELSAALLGGRQTVDSAFEDLPRSDHQARDLHQLIATFDGDRHVEAVLMTTAGATLRSIPYHTAIVAPAWFAAILDPRLSDVRITAPVAPRGQVSIDLRPIPADDIGDSWRLATHAALVLALVCGLGVALVYVTIGQALRPLGDLVAALARVGAGDYDARVTLRGPRELDRLSQSFNTMAGELSAMRRRTRLLEEQVLKLQDEERADLARDLHDDFGPHLFAANIDATMIGQALAAGRPEEAMRHVRSIQGAVARMQRQVRDILGRLRPARLTELGFVAAINDLVDFWRVRRKDVAFAVELALDETQLPEAVQEVAYRVVQEGLSNAVRHGRPGRIAVTLAARDERLDLRVEDDGAVREKPDDRPRFGLVGMRERVEAIGGTLTVAPGAARGWTLTVQIPLTAPATVSDLERA